MALIQCNFYSHAIQQSTIMNVILPQSRSNEPMLYPTLYLLHGYNDDYSGWLRKTSLDRYISGKKIAIVMPDVQKSFYSNFSDFPDGYQYWTFVSKELLDISRHFFPLSTKREDTFVAGLSMGGFGAFKLALNCPETFSAAASLSGALDMVRVATEEKRLHKELDMIFGGTNLVSKSENDLFHISTQLHLSQKTKPRLYQCCGTKDFLYTDNVKFKNHIHQLNTFDYTYSESIGDHNWTFWDKELKSVIDWLCLDDLKASKPIFQELEEHA